MKLETLEKNSDFWNFIYVFWNFIYQLQDKPELENQVKRTIYKAHFKRKIHLFEIFVWIQNDFLDVVLI